MEDAARRDPGAARPFARFGGWLARSGRAPEAAAAYARAADRKPVAWLPRVVLPRLLRDAGRSEDAERALADAHSFSRSADAWSALEAAWRELPPPRTNEILVGGLDYGAARGFLAPVHGERWSRARASLRLAPLDQAARYDLTLEMGSPAPSPLERPEVRLSVNGGPWTRFTLERETRAYHVLAQPGPDGVLAVELRSPTWALPGIASDQGVLVRRLAAAPVR